PIFVSNGLRKSGSRHLCTHLKVRNKCEETKFLSNLLFYAVNFTLINNRRDKPTQNCWCGIIRMSFHNGGKIHKLILTQRVSHELICTKQTTYNTSGTTAQPSCHWYVVFLLN